MSELATPFVTRSRTGNRVGRVRFGYDLAEDGSTLIPNRDEQDAIAWMRDMRTAGLTLRQIANALGESGIATKEGRLAWSHSAVSYILKRSA